jgi:hypothetical protein
MVSTVIFQPGAKPTIASYNGSVVKIYNAATSNLVRIEKKNILFAMKKRYILCTTTLAS